MPGTCPCSPTQPNLHPDEAAQKMFPSRGAAVHHIGQCTPCKFFRTRRGCKDEERCALCHYPHPELTFSGVRRAMKQRSQEKKVFLRACNGERPSAPVPLGGAMSV